jgi:hypothetical protein
MYTTNEQRMANSEKRKANNGIQDLFKYPPKIIVAFGEAIHDNKEIQNWLLKNGYPELAALAFAIRGSNEAFEWLMKNGYYSLAALDSAIDEDQKAYQWLRDNHLSSHIVFADACAGKKEAIEWFLRNRLLALFRITQMIKKLRDSHTFDYHKLHF